MAAPRRWRLRRTSRRSCAGLRACRRLRGSSSGPRRIWAASPRRPRSPSCGRWRAPGISSERVLYFSRGPGSVQIPRLTRKTLAAAMAAAASLLLLGAAPAAPAPPRTNPAPAEPPEVRFTIGEDALLDWLKAATPYTFSVGNQLLKIDLTLSDPRDLRLSDSKATFRVRLRGAGLALDQVLQPVFVLRHDPTGGQYTVAV